MTYSEIWPASGSMRSGRVCERPTLELPIYDDASSSSPPYPTPSSVPYGSSGNGTGNNTDSRGRPSLDSMARCWPTPMHRDGKGGHVSDQTFNKPGRGPMLHEAVERWFPTPIASGEDKGPTYPRGNPTLQGVARCWPTPATTDAAAAARGTTTTGVMHPGTSLTDALRGHLPPGTPTRGPDGMVLCPEFVEALMGLPAGWTHVDDERVLECSATPASRSKRRRRGKASSPA